MAHGTFRPNIKTRTHQRLHHDKIRSISPSSAGNCSLGRKCSTLFVAPFSRSTSEGVLEEWQVLVVVVRLLLPAGEELLRQLLSFLVVASLTERLGENIATKSSRSATFFLVILCFSLPLLPIADDDERLVVSLEENPRAFGLRTDFG